MNIINNLITGMDNVKASANQSFQPGQILNGKILKLFPNQIAAVQVGSQQVVAQLEAPLDVQKRYWFQVQPGEGKVKLKVIGEAVKEGAAGGEQSVNSSLLKELSIPANRENINMLRFFLNERLPVNKENIQKAHQWMKEAPSRQIGQEAIKLLHQKDLPITKSAFQAIYTVLENESLSQSIETLRGQLGNYSLFQSGNRLFQFLQSMHESQEMFSASLKEPIQVHRDESGTALQWMKESKSLQLGQEIIKLMQEKQLPMTKDVFQAMYTLLEKTPLPQREERLTQLLQSLSHRENIGNPAAIAKNQTNEPPSFVHFLKEMTKSIGFSYESHLAHQFNEHSNEQKIKLETLKSLLIDFVQETPTEQIKETTEKILNKITGFQLLGQESGPIQQFVFQIPINLQQKNMDLTIQWNGRKTKSGEIDPSFCRILFYLELEHLHETMVDMQVQNRVISITVMNENKHIQKYAAPLIRSLKEKLEMMDYTLSFVHFTPLSENHHEKQKQNPYVGLSSYSGVDLRI